MPMNKTIVVCAILAGFALAVPAYAQDKAPSQGKAPSTTLNIGVTMTDGNSETMQANASLVTEGEKEGLGSVRAGAEANYGESSVKGTNSTTINNARLFGNAKKTITARLFGYLDASVLNDDIADIDYRAMIGPGLGVFLVKNEKTSLSVEAGPSYLWEKVAGESDNYLTVRFAERIDQTLGSSAKAWQSAEYLPRTEDFGDYLLNAELGVESAMTESVSLRIVLQEKYDSTPGADLKKSDLTLIGGISVKL